jgi:hypothetical protein
MEDMKAGAKKMRVEADYTDRQERDGPAKARALRAPRRTFYWSQERCMFASEKFPGTSGNIPQLMSRITLRQRDA